MRPTNKEIKLSCLGQFQTEAAMIGDAVMILANALVEKETFKLEFKAKPIECHRFRSDMEENSSGQAILDNIDNVIDTR